MADDVINMIIDNLRRIEEKQDKHTEQLARIDSRLGILEIKEKDQAKVEERLRKLESLKDEGVGIKTVLLWLITTGIAVASAIKSFMR